MSVACPEHRLAAAEWAARRAAHRARAATLTSARLARASAGRTDPVEDFLFTYYPFRPSALARWSPGWGVVLEGEPPAGEAWWETCEGGFRVAARERGPKALERARFIRELCLAVAARPAFHACHGLHEWAMVYRSAEARRHSAWPLRLGAGGTDAVVESLPIRCSHHDAFRFFTAAARPLNRLSPDLAGRVANEQPGCIHANMDLYKWVMKLGPLAPAELAADSFDLAADARRIDMRASPYDFREAGLEPLAIETAEGRLAHEREQRRLAAAAAPLRARLIVACDRALAG